MASAEALDEELENLRDSDIDEEVADSASSSASDCSVLFDETNFNDDSGEDKMFTQAKLYLSTYGESPNKLSMLDWSTRHQTRQVPSKGGVSSFYSTVQRGATKAR